MAIIPVNEILEIRSHLTVHGSWKVGVIAGVVHHLICQVPPQKDVLTCLYVFAFSDAFCVITILSKSPPPFFSALLSLLTFNATYVYLLTKKYLISDLDCLGSQSGL